MYVPIYNHWVLFLYIADKIYSPIAFVKRRFNDDDEEEEIKEEVEI